jgi:hypothetical protein
MAVESAKEATKNPLQFLISTTILPGWTKLTRQLDFLLFERVRWIWGLTSEFPGKFAKDILGTLR